MSSKYEINLISIKEKDRLMKKYSDRFLYEKRADIYGCCIKLLTDIKYVKNRWEEIFYPMSVYVRSHGRLVVTSEESEEHILEDSHGINSVHGACIEEILGL